MFKLNIVHGDLKDENILIDPQKLNTWIIDLGASNYSHRVPFSEFLGTRIWSPTEYIKDQINNGRAATIWALGLILFELLNGEIPYLDDDSILRGDLKFQKEISKEAVDLIKKMSGSKTFKTSDFF